MSQLLSVKGVEKAFVGVKVLSGVDLEVGAGEIHALLGENGAGKSTLMKILCGVYSMDAGTIRIDGEEKHFSDYEAAVEAGIGIVFQEFSLIPHLTAVENIFLGREIYNGLGLLKRAEMRRHAMATLDRLKIDINLDVPIRHLSVAQQQFIEIAKALSLNARILILDEPTATLTPTEAEQLFAVMRELKRQGVGIIFISHHLDEIFEICDRITVLRDGNYVGTVDVAATDIDSLVEMMVGRRIAANFPPKPAINAARPVVLDVEEIQLERGGPVNAFSLREGEILGFAGLVGSGRTETALGVIGATRPHRCRLKVDGVARNFTNPADALECGIGLLPESRKEEGLITSFSVRDNVSINNLWKYTSHIFIDRAEEQRATIDVMGRVRMKAQGPQTQVATLSGGNQQKVVVARWLNHSVKILFFDEPTRGIDVGAKAEIYQIMRDMTKRGYSIVMISSELPEIVGMCDRVCVFREGKITQTLVGEAITPAEVMRYATAGEINAAA
ncbi:sugar ABC transporter ATP-binding protein [Consotaella salsifontis]|uniref:Monosaccharide ABC transporter ATP-binding protein, CUT2 family n=1 Tax=Consotaella salsifontis TaxID=1365950 RepID=A0A1T4SD50_9HYPH|nr:sugar ABC transporter ATP-binding protein [Consotaella salsifontis]SKA26115.1 monosaccharide ABC transporter ATP-binding protein, CUT2 family [Consotaella salsifontis]